MDSTPAINKIIMSGSLNFSKNCFQSGSFSGGVNTLIPCFLRLSSTCASVKPITFVLFDIIIINFDITKWVNGLSILNRFTHLKSYYLCIRMHLHVSTHSHVLELQNNGIQVVPYVLDQYHSRHV